MQFVRFERSGWQSEFLLGRFANHLSLFLKRPACISGSITRSTAKSRCWIWQECIPTGATKSHMVGNAAAFDLFWRDRSRVLRSSLAKPAPRFYAFNLDDHVPANQLLRGIDRFLDLSELHEHLAPNYSHIGHSSIDPALIIRMQWASFEDLGASTKPGATHPFNRCRSLSDVHDCVCAQWWY